MPAAAATAIVMRIAKTISTMTSSKELRIGRQLLENDSGLGMIQSGSILDRS
jgi:hypothetical protein